MLGAFMSVWLQACADKYDDAEVWDAINGLESRVKAVEVVLAAYENNILIQTVEETSNGYIITFTDGSTAVIENGINGADGADGDTLIADISVGDNAVTFILSDGTTIVIPIYDYLKIEFDMGDLIGMTPNMTREINYTIESDIENVEIEVVSSSNVEAKIVKTSAFEGVVHIKTLDVVNEYSKAVVFVSNGRRVIMRSILIEGAKLLVEDNSIKDIPVEGGEFALEFLSNIEYTVEISEEGRGWITLLEPRAMHKQIVNISVAPNTGEPRAATLTIKSKDGAVSVIYHIKQQTTNERQIALEREALVAMYDEMDGANWVYARNWCSDKPVSEWMGVYVNSEGFVEGLNMTSSNINGAIPKQIENLRHLRLLILSDNNITDVSNLQTLQKLEVLNLERCNLSGSFPRELTRCSNLKYLTLAFNNLTGELPEELGDMKELLYLRLSDNKFSGEIPSSIEQNTQFWAANWWHILLDNDFDVVDAKIPAPQITAKDINGNTIYFSDEYKKNRLTLLYEYSTDAFFDQGNQEAFNLVKLILKRYGDYGLNCIGIAAGTGYPDSTVSLTDDVIEFVNKENLQDWITIINGGEGEKISLITGEIPKLINGKYYSDVVYAHSWLNEGVPDAGISSITLVDSEGCVVWSNAFPDSNMLFADARSFIGAVSQYLGKEEGLAEVVTVQTASQGNGIDLVVMGDAFSAESHQSGLYKETMLKAIEILFGEEPYKSFRSLFNIYIVNVVSEHDGYHKGDSALGGNVNDATRAGSVDALTISYALSALGEENRLNNCAVLVVLNTTTRSTCRFITDWDKNAIMSVAHCACKADSDSFAGVVLHELGGHGIGLLGDEYEEHEEYINETELKLNISYRDKFGMFENIDFTSDPEKVRWAKFLSDSRYANEDLGVFEGGGTYWYGVWRPSRQSYMRHSSGGYNAPSREAIYKRIHHLAYGDNWTYDYEKFVEWDARNRIADATRATTKRSVNYEQLHKPATIINTRRKN